MTTSDKTGEKLTASIRKTKASAEGKVAATTTRKAAPNRAAKATPKAAPRTTTRASSPAKRTAGSDTADSYRHGSRVWPD